MNNKHAHRYARDFFTNPTYTAMVEELKEAYRVTDTKMKSLIRAGDPSVAHSMGVCDGIELALKRIENMQKETAVPLEQAA